MSSDATSHEPGAAIFAEAAGWLVDFREGYVDAAGERRFYAWLRRSPEHIQAYMEAAALWGDIPKLASGMEIDVEAIVARARAESRITSLATTTAAPPPPRCRASYSSAADASDSAPVAGTDGDRGRWRTVPTRRMFAGALAAAALTVAIIGWPLSRGAVYATAIGEQRLLTLHDGSTIELGARSRIRVQLTTHERDIELLAGQALFTVAKDPRRPFVVVANHTRVRVVGTQFGVHRRMSGTTVTVLEGRVAVYSPSRREGTPVVSTTATSPQSAGVLPAIYLAAGEQVTVPELNPTVPPHPHSVDVHSATAWTERTLTFDDAPLSDVVEEFNRYNDRQILLTDPALQSLRISGVFAATKPNSLLSFLREQMHLDVSSTADSVRVSPRMTEN